MTFSQQDLSELLETAIVAARLAGQHAMEAMSYAKVSTKKGVELVTDADRECQRIIISRIKETYPDHGFIAEEGENDNIFKQTPRGSEKCWWIIDPIDGTNNFAFGIPLFAVSIGVLCEGKPVVGVIYEPATDSMFTAVQGQEAMLNNRRIVVNDKGFDKLSTFGIDSHFTESLPSWACEVILKTRFRNMGSAALHMAYVANGGLIATILGKIKLWDIAAGALICECAGAKVCDWKGNSIWPADLENYNGEPIALFASNNTVYSDLLQLIGAK